MNWSKHIFILLLLVSNVLVVRSQSLADFDNAIANLHPNKSLATLTIKKYSSGDSTNYKKVISSFDAKGLKVKEVTYEKNSNKVLSQSDYSYDSAGRLIEVNTTISGKKQVVTSCKYTDEPKVMQKDEFVYLSPNIEPKKYSSVYNYGNDTMLDKLELVSPGHTIIYKCFYNNQNQKTSEEYFNGNNELLYWLELNYDDKGNLSSKKRFNSQGELEHEARMEYDSKGLLVKSTEYNSKGVETKKKTYYYADGRLIKLDIVSNGKLISSIRKIYDTNGNLVYDGQKNEYYVYNKENLPIEKGKVNEDKKHIPQEAYSYTYR